MQGQGPPFVLVHGPVHDGDIAWEALLPHLTDRFTCYLPSLRGRGVSGDNSDHSPPRFQEDVNAFVDSIGNPVCLMGWSDGGSLALGAAAHSGAVAAVAYILPTLKRLEAAAQGESPSGQLSTDTEALERRLRRASLANVLLLTLAVVTMATARYWG